MLGSDDNRAAPEYLSSWVRTLSSDVYSLGIILLELLLREDAYANTSLKKYESDGRVNRRSFVRDVLHGFRPTIPGFCPPQYAEIIKACLVYDGFNPYTQETFHRPSIDDVLSMLHAWKV